MISPVGESKTLTRIDEKGPYTFETYDREDWVDESALDETLLKIYPQVTLDQVKKIESLAKKHLEIAKATHQELRTTKTQWGGMQMKLQLMTCLEKPKLKPLQEKKKELESEVDRCKKIVADYKTKINTAQAEYVKASEEFGDNQTKMKEARKKNQRHNITRLNVKIPTSQKACSKAIAELQEVEKSLCKAAKAQQEAEIKVLQNKTAIEKCEQARDTKRLTIQMEELSQQIITGDQLLKKLEKNCATDVQSCIEQNLPGEGWASKDERAEIVKVAVDAVMRLWQLD
jgi:chromosome segregation ATPase